MTRILPLALLALLAVSLFWEPSPQELPPAVPSYGGHHEARRESPNGWTAPRLTRSPGTHHETTLLRQHLAQGRPLVLNRDREEETTLLVRPHPILAPDFQLTRGRDPLVLGDLPEVFRGWAFTSSSEEAPRQAHLAIAGNQVAACWTDDRQRSCQLAWTAGTPTAQLIRSLPSPFTARIETSSTHPLSTCSLQEPLAQVPGRSETLAIPIDLPIAARGGLEPATGEPAHYVNPIAMPEPYALSLKDMELLLVLDKSASGVNDDASLQRVASQWLASVANVATIYENQLGIRLLLQELILIPDDAVYEDIPSDSALSSFINWLGEHRPRNVQKWDAAFKAGRGLRSSELGLAYVGALGRSDAIGIISPTTGWATLAHELGHTLGANHTAGGLMNSQANGGGDRDFFTPAIGRPHVSAAQEIYEHAESRLSGEAKLRSPTEIPFALNDFRVVPDGKESFLDPSANDLRSVRFGQTNHSLSVEAIGPLTPPGAGVLQHLGPHIRFIPSPGFSGPAWFSYALRGSLGQDGEGWLHKGDVTLQVGHETPSLAGAIVLSPGETRTVEIGEISNEIRQPQQAIAHLLQDHADHVVIRAQIDAVGKDELWIGNTRYEIIYRASDAEGMGTRADTYWHHPALGRLRLFPLANDQPSSRGNRTGQTNTTVGSEGTSLTLEFPVGGHRLIDVQNLAPEKGDVHLVRSTSGDPTGEIQFTPAPDAQGQVTLRYRAMSPDGLVANESIVIHLHGTVDTLVPQNAQAVYRVPRTAEDADTWMLKSFDDRLWFAGQLPLGYEDGSGYEDWIETDVRLALLPTNTSLYTRIPFEVSDPESIDRLILRMRSDDGFVVYLNGRLVFSENAPEPISWHASALESREATQWETHDLSDARSFLTGGENLLAIHALNASADSSDFLLMPELQALSLPSLGHIVSPRAASLNVKPGSGIVFQASTARANMPPGVSEDDPIFFHWSIVQAGAPVKLAPGTGPDAGKAWAHFPEAGTFRIRLTASNGDGVITRDERTVQVGEARPFDLPLDSLTANAAQTPDAPQLALTAQWTPVVPGVSASYQWETIEGPTGLAFNDPASATPIAQLPSPGRYRVRVTVEQEAFTLFDELTVDHALTTRTLIGDSAVSLYRIFNTARFDTNWKERDYLPGHEWELGGRGLGYDISKDYTGYIDTDLKPLLQFKESSVYVRYPFLIDDLESMASLRLFLRIDDGCVIYLNGQEVFRQHAPLYDLGPESVALRSIDETLVESPLGIDLSHAIVHLKPGRNLLAINGLNHQSASSDFLIQPELVAEMGPERPATPAEDAERLHFALMGPSPPLKVDTTPSRLILNFYQHPEFEALGGIIEVEASSDLVNWRPWLPEGTEITSTDKQGWHVRLTGPRSEDTRFLRLRLP